MPGVHWGVMSEMIARESPANVAFSSLCAWLLRTAFSSHHDGDVLHRGEHLDGSGARMLQTLGLALRANPQTP